MYIYLEYKIIHNHILLIFFLNIKIRFFNETMKINFIFSEIDLFYKSHYEKYPYLQKEKFQENIATDNFICL